MSSLLRRPASWYLSYYCAPGCKEHPAGGRRHLASLRTKDRRLAEQYQKDKNLEIRQQRARLVLGLVSTATAATRDWTLETFIDQYERKVKDEQLVSLSTWNRAERWALQSLLRFRPRAELADLTDEWMRSYQAAVKPTMAPHTWKSRRATLRAIGNRAVGWKWLAVNPFLQLDPVTPKKKRPKRLLQEQVSLVIAAIPNQLWRLVALFLYATGVRRGELVRLKREHVRWEQGYLEIETNKENEPKVIALTPALHTIIEQAQALDRSPYVFSRNGHPLHEEAVKNYFRWISKKVGFAVSTHRFRHSHGTHRMEAGDNLRTVADTLGHADIRTTAYYYLDFDLPAQRAAMERLPIAKLLTLPLARKKVGVDSIKTESDTVQHLEKKRKAP